ncbi:uncharacterized protein LOC108093567 [Drosophila ficusphila]|nr:uncharacterized protein LOC108093567 [Drosophila ficusphila]
MKALQIALVLLISSAFAMGQNNNTNENTIVIGQPGKS